MRKHSKISVLINHRKLSRNYLVCILLTIYNRGLAARDSLEEGDVLGVFGVGDRRDEHGAVGGA